MKKVSGPQVVTAAEAAEMPLLRNSGGAGRAGRRGEGGGARAERERRAWRRAPAMEAEVDEVVGPKGKRNPDRTAKRHGHERGSMTLGGRRVEVSRPRMRTADDEHELPVPPMSTSPTATR